MHTMHTACTNAYTTAGRGSIGALSCANTTLNPFAQAGNNLVNATQNGCWQQARKATGHLLATTAITLTTTKTTNTLTAKLPTTNKKSANTASIFTSADAHVAGAANTIEAAMPGRVVGVSTQRLMSNGLTREVDIDLGNVLVQVKSGNARGLTGQIQRTEASAGVRTVGYAPDISDAAWFNAARQGIPILRSPQELKAYVREFG